MEDLEEDTAAVLIRSGNKEFFKRLRDFRVNSSDEKGVNDMFWRKVPAHLRRAIRIVFQEDFDMFGYA